MFGCADAAERSRRIGDDADRLAQERALAIGPRSDVNGILQHAGNRTVVFRRDEQDAVRFLQFLAKRQPVGRRCGLEVLVEERNAVQRRDVELERSRRKLRQRIGDLERKALLAQAADDRDDGMRGGHEISFSKRDRTPSLKPHL